MTLSTLRHSHCPRCPECGSAAYRLEAYGNRPGWRRFNVECTGLECNWSIVIEEGPKGGLTRVKPEPIRMEQKRSWCESKTMVMKRKGIKR